MTKIVRMRIVLEDRNTQTLISEDIFDSHYPMYVDDDKLFQIRPIGNTLRGFEIDVDTLNDIDGVKTIGNPVEYSTTVGDNISNVQTNGFKTDTRFTAGSNITVDYPTETGKIALISDIQASDSWAESLAIDNASGANDVIVTAGQKITTDTIDETTSAAGVTIDGLLLKDGNVGGHALTGDSDPLVSTSANQTLTNKTLSGGTISDSLTFADSVDINFNTSNGTKIGGATNEKFAFYGATPIIQGSAVSDPSGGATVDAEARTAIIALIDRFSDAAGGNGLIE